MVVINLTTLLEMVGLCSESKKWASLWIRYLLSGKNMSAYKLAQKGQWKILVNRYQVKSGHLFVNGLLLNLPFNSAGCVCVRHWKKLKKSFYSVLGK